MSDTKYIDGKLNLNDSRVTEYDCYKEICAVSYLKAAQILSRFKQESMDILNAAAANGENPRETLQKLSSIQNTR